MATPVPLSLTGEPVTVAPVQATVSVPLETVAVVGLNATLLVQLAPTANVAEQVPVVAMNPPPLKANVQNRGDQDRDCDANLTALRQLGHRDYQQRDR